MKLMLMWLYNLRVGVPTVLKAHFLAGGNKIASSDCILRIVPGQKTAGGAPEGTPQRLRSFITQRNWSSSMECTIWMVHIFAHTSLWCSEKRHPCYKLSCILASLKPFSSFVSKHRRVCQELWCLAQGGYSDNVCWISEQIIDHRLGTNHQYLCDQFLSISEL